MSTMMVSSSVECVGELAGIVWHTLSEQGPLTPAKLVKSVDAPRDLVLMAVGWLAREDKIQIKEKNRGRVISLR